MSESDVCRRQILTSEDGPSSERVEFQRSSTCRVTNAVKKKPRRGFTVSFKYSYIRAIWNSGMAMQTLSFAIIVFMVHHHRVWRFTYIKRQSVDPAKLRFV